MYPRHQNLSKLKTEANQTLTVECALIQPDLPLFQSEPTNRMFTVPVKPQLPSQTHNNNEHAVTSLRERLKDLSAHDDADAKKKDVQPQQPSASFKAPKTPKYLDVTTAFFSGPIVRGHEEKTQPEHKFRTPQIPVTHTPTTYPPRGHRKLQQRQQHQTPQQQQPRESESTRGFSIVESPDAQALVRRSTQYKGRQWVP